MEGILQKSQVPGKKLTGIYEKEPASFKRMQLPGKKTEVICKRAGVLEKTWYEFSKESGFWKKTDRNLEKSRLLLKEFSFLAKRLK